MDHNDDVQSWESDEKKWAWTKLGPQSVENVDFFKSWG